MDERLVGRSLGRYSIVERIGAGGMGVVYRAHDLRLGRDIALKLLPAEGNLDPILRARLIREARAASALNHPHICTVYDVGEHEGSPFLAMELLEGETLRNRLARGPIGSRPPRHWSSSFSGEQRSRR